MGSPVVTHRKICISRAFYNPANCHEVETKFPHCRFKANVVLNPHLNLRLELVMVEKPARVNEILKVYKQTKHFLLSDDSTFLTAVGIIKRFSTNITKMPLKM